MPSAPPPAPAVEPPETVYRRRRERYEREARELRRRSSAVTRGRVATFFGGAVCLAPALVGTEDPRVPWLVAAGALFVVFFALVAVDGRLARRIRWIEALRDVNGRAMARRSRDFDRLPPCPPAAELLGSGSGRAARAAKGAADGSIDAEAEEPTEEDGAPGPFVRDLHLFGRASLFRLVSTARSPAGRRRLARWLAEPATAAEVVRRQAAVRALASALAERQEVEAAGMGVAEGAPDLERFYHWAEGDSWLARHRWRLWAARVLTVLVPGSFIAFLAGLVSWELFVSLAMASYLLSAASAEVLHDVFDRATFGGDGLLGYGPLFRAVESLPGGTAAGRAAGKGDESPGGTEPGLPYEGSLLDDLAGRLAPAGRSAAEWMDRLERLTVLSDVRHGLIYFFVQVVTLWAFHVAARFEVWQRQAGPSVRGWLEALGELEALCSLAALAHAEPEWAWPAVGVGVGQKGGISESPEPPQSPVKATTQRPVDAPAREPVKAPDTFRALDLGHPLIPGDRRVGNDVEVGPPGTFLLVTGSNMSGKTTLIRAIGVNAVLAEAGGPVCARELTMPPLRLATSIVVEDSLEEGVSFFMAELLRLKSVVDAAATEAEGADGRRLLYLLDEVLRGTNSAERRVAIQRVLGRLLELGAIGAITTHDLQILAEGALERSAVPIHFRETIRPKPEGGADMTFDFISRPGLAPTTNALRLLEAVGLGDGEEPAPSAEVEERVAEDPVGTGSGPEPAGGGHEETGR